MNRDEVIYKNSGGKQIIKHMIIGGVADSVAGWARHEDCDVTCSTILGRLRGGMGPRDAVFTKKAHGGGRKARDDDYTGTAQSAVSEIISMRWA